jgi:peptidoglycan hydrolase-like protein with peptidoglycan-binding domain
MSQNQNQQNSFAQHQKEFQKKPAAAQQSGPLSFTDFFSALMNPFKPTSVASTTSATMPVLKEGDSGAGVAAVQVALKYHKIDLGTSGNLGVWEPGTTMGVKTFQQQNGLPVTGQLDGMTWAKLMV